MVKKRAKPEDDRKPILEEESVGDGDALPPEDDHYEESALFVREAEPAQAQEESQVELSSEDQWTALWSKLDEIQEKADEYLDGWQRSRAEFANYKKRIERERDEEGSRIKGEIIMRFLNVMDDLERAIRERPQQGDMAAWADGIDMIYRKLNAIFESEGVTRIEALGKQFDPNYHEAILQVESDDHQEGEIVEVIQQGYQIGDRVLRPALVRVAK